MEHKLEYLREMVQGLSSSSWEHERQDIYRIFKTITEILDSLETRVTRNEQ